MNAQASLEWIEHCNWFGINCLLNIILASPSLTVVNNNRSTYVKIEYKYGLVFREVMKLPRSIDFCEMRKCRKGSKSSPLLLTDQHPVLSMIGKVLTVNYLSCWNFHQKKLFIEILVCWTPMDSIHLQNCFLDRIYWINFIGKLLIWKITAVHLKVNAKSNELHLQNIIVALNLYSLVSHGVQLSQMLRRFHTGVKLACESHEWRTKYVGKSVRSNSSRKPVSKSKLCYFLFQFVWTSCLQEVSGTLTGTNS